MSTTQAPRASTTGYRLAIREIRKNKAKWHGLLAFWVSRLRQIARNGRRQREVEGTLSAWPMESERLGPGERFC